MLSLNKWFETNYKLLHEQEYIITGKDLMLTLTVVNTSLEPTILDDWMNKRNTL